ncbi:hypothetical protein PM082_000199 [Marasmius tenuissimus]|nr:hypothetical protein PM082_000199 [Marasmius tenuissimus]
MNAPTVLYGTKSSSLFLAFTPERFDSSPGLNESTYTMLSPSWSLTGCFHLDLTATARCQPGLLFVLCWLVSCWPSTLSIGTRLIFMSPLLDFISPRGILDEQVDGSLHLSCRPRTIYAALASFPGRPSRLSRCFEHWHCQSPHLPTSSYRISIETLPNTPEALARSVQLLNVSNEYLFLACGFVFRRRVIVSLTVFNIEDGENVIQ